MPTKYSLSLYSIFTEHPFSSCIYSNSWKVKHVECTSCSQLKIWPNLSFNHFFTTKCRLSKIWGNFHQNNFRIFLSKVDDLYMVYIWETNGVNTIMSLSKILDVEIHLSFFVHCSLDASVFEILRIDQPRNTILNLWACIHQVSIHWDGMERSLGVGERIDRNMKALNMNKFKEIWNS